MLAQEISHILINRADPLSNQVCFDREYDSERRYSFQQLQERLNPGECQANSMAAMLLMPQPLVESTMRRYFQCHHIHIYGDCVLHPSIKLAVNAMVDELGVSFSTLLIQLKKYNMVEHHDIADIILTKLNLVSDALALTGKF